MSDIVTLREAPWKAGLRGARANLLPGFVLQMAALGLVLGYYYYPPMRAVLGRVTDLHARIGCVFGIVSTSLFGGVLPLFYLWSHSATRSQYDGRQALALIGFWGYKGLEVELWYRLLAFTVGPGHAAGTIVIKSFLDQFVYCPVYAVPVTVLAYQWCASRFDHRSLWDDFRTPGWYARSILPTLIANFGVWLPTVAIIYALPTPLQLPLENLVLCFYTLMLAHMNRREENRRETPRGPLAQAA